MSGVGRDIRSMTGTTIRDVVQTDAAINPGAQRWVSGGGGTRVLAPTASNHLLTAHRMG